MGNELPDPRVERETDHPWHVAINRHHDQLRKERGANGPWPHKSWMYEAKAMSQEVPRMVLLFEKERLGRLPVVHKQCSRSPTQPVVDNHLTCCLGVQCRRCPELLALDSAEISPEERDRVKAWTCAGHIMSEGGDPANTGFILTEDDKIFWDTVHENLAVNCPEEPTRAKTEDDGG